MKRPLCVIGLVLALTTPAAFFAPAHLRLPLSAALALTAVLLHLLRRRRLRVACVALFAAALAFASLALHHTRESAPFERAAGETVGVQGLITEAALHNRTAFYTLRATFPENPHLPDTVLSLRAYGEMEHRAGDVIAGAVVLDGAVTPGDYGYSRGQRASGVLQGGARRLEGGYALRRALLALQTRMMGNLYDTLPADTADLLCAMVLGRQDNVSPEVYSAVNRAGTSHLLAVSGLHLSILTGIALNLFGALRLPRRASALLALLCALGFAFLAGFSASVTRALIMTGIALLARAGPRRSDSLTSLGLAVCIICLARPAWALGRGFWLSAGSTLGIVVFSGRITRWLDARIKGGLAAQNRYTGAMLGAFTVSVSAYAFAFPLLVLFNGWISLVSPLANVAAAPYVTPLVAGGMLCAVLGAASPPMRLVAWATDACAVAVTEISRLFSALPFATLPLDEAWMLLWLLFLTGAAAVLWRWRGPRRLAAYAAALAVLLLGGGSLVQAVSDRDTVQLATIGDCDTAVLLRGETAVILGVPRRGEVGPLLRYLEFRGVRHIAAVVAADAGEQVDSGLLRLHARYPIDCVIGPDDAYVLGQIAAAVADVPVYSGGYAGLEVLGGAQLALTLPGGDILLRTRDTTVFKTAQAYGAQDSGAGHNIRLYGGGVTALDGARGRDPSPIGAMLFGERRWRLRV